ncbi:MAG: DHHA1 domain-containing protein [Candidatus Pacebacteria bacterium]|nr:DHHA1 domain-containing protein [Candidatus Paceibacterota bacterium]
MTKIKNIEIAAQRIEGAIKNEEKIVLYGDADLDGTVSVVLLKDIIELLGGKVFMVYFPDRETEGYGINSKALKLIKQKAKKSKTLLIVVDCGIANFKEAILAKKLGIDLIIADHHQPHSELPLADIIVCPKQKGDKYHFKDFANAGIILYLCQELLGSKFAKKEKDFLTLAALATIADMMKQESDNKEIIDLGLKYLKQNKRPGLKYFWKSGLVTKCPQERDAVQKINSIVGSSGIKYHRTQIYDLLVAKDIKKAEKIVNNLVKKWKEKQARVLKMIDKVEKIADLNSPIIFFGSPDWKINLLGSAASKIENKYKKPVFLYKKGGKNSRGAVRVPAKMNAVLAMEKSADILLTYGGHPPAAGFNVENKHIEEFESRLIKYFKNI